MQVTNDSKSKIDENQLSKLIDRKIREELTKKNDDNDDGFDFVDGALIVTAGVSLLVPSVLTLL